MEKEINLNWQFRQADSDEWMEADVPGCVHTDLMKNGKIDDPFYRLNEHDIQWIDKKDWEYKTSFEVEREILDKDHIELLFKGLDTQADVYLNGKRILIASNMFREWAVDVKDNLKPEGNELAIYFHSPVNTALEKYNSLNYEIPVSNNDLSELGGLGDKRVSVHIRKAGYHFGWDWGPRLATSGIWKPIILHGWNTGTIEDLFVRQKELTDKEAKLTAEINIRALSVVGAKLVCEIDGQEASTNDIELKKGENIFTVPLKIENPGLWWPNGLGKQKLYNISVKLAISSNILSKKSVRIGLRTVNVVQEPDTAGRSFYFVINGVPVFMKGANYIPRDVFLNRVTPDHYKYIIESAVNANMNMLRVWGGGIYEKDIFYDLCDEYGILVWQDFMFACAMFPGDEQFLDNVMHEAVDNVTRLRNHPSIALWCGNNECLSGWVYWGWREMVIRKYGKETADIIWKGYDDLFHHILPQVVKELDNDRLYWSSSPCAGFGEPSDWRSGDMHYWGVWWDKEPFVNYRTNIARFMSEYGCQSFPGYNTVCKYTIEEDHDIYSKVMESHQRATNGNKVINYYMKQNYRKPENFRMFLYTGQLLQAEGVKVAMEGHRKHMPYCMGSLYWQINDCWPVTSWSSIDYYGQWKALHYYARKAFNDILISPETDGETTKVFIVSDRLKETPATMELMIMNFTGKQLWNNKQEITIRPSASQVYFNGENTMLLGNQEKSSVLLYAKVKDKDGRLISDNTFYYAEPKDLDLPQPEIKTEIIAADGIYKIKITTDKLAKNIYLSVQGIEGFFSDNYVDVLPGRLVEITFKTAGPSEGFEDKLEIVSLRDTY